MGPNGLEHREVTAARRRPQTLVLKDRSQGLAGAVVGECVASGRVVVSHLERRNHMDSCLGKQPIGLSPARRYALQLAVCQHPLDDRAALCPSHLALIPIRTSGRDLTDWRKGSAGSASFQVSGLTRRMFTGR